MSQEILVVDDEPDITAILQGLLEDEGYTVRVAGSGEQAIEAVRERLPNLVLLDIWLGESRFDGLKVLDIIKATHGDVPVIMMSGHGTIETAIAAMRKGAYDFIEKPFQSERLILLIQRALDVNRLKKENEELRQKVVDDSTLVGKSQTINALRELIQRVAQTNSRVLISGPSGSGKETVAFQIHQLSKRAAGRFVVLNCANLDPSRIESELFGQETSDSCYVGLLEQAHQGTLYLDEVCDLNAEIQAKMVKALQSNVFQRVNGNSKVTVDVRVISATSYNLQEAVAEKRLREDLYYRLNVVPIEVMPLVERLEDIPELSQFFLNCFAKINGYAPKKLSDEANIMLQAYTWPGNVRQLKNAMEWIMIMHGSTPDEFVTPQMLPQEIVNKTPTFLSRDHVADVLQLPLRDAREQFERDYLMAQVARFGGNISRTAYFIGMERSALHRKLRSLTKKAS